MKAKKIGLLLLCVLLLAVAALAGCSKNTAEEPKQDPANEQPTETSDSDAQPADEPASAEETKKFDDTTIRIMTWHFGAESSFGIGYREIADDYMKIHPEVKVEFIEQPLDGYIEKLNANLELDSDTALDIAHLQPWMIDQVKNSGKLMDMTPSLAQKSAYADEARWIDTFVGGEEAFTYAKASNQFGHILFIPSDTNPNYFVAQPIVYNKSVFEQAGITSDPKTWTWSEFIENSKKIQEWGKQNIDPDFTALASNSEHYGWTFGMIGGQMGADLFDDQFSKVDFSSEGEGLDPNAPYVSGDSLLWAKMSYAITHGWLDYQGNMKAYYDDMLRLYKELHELYQPGFEQQTSTESSQLFYMGRVAMIQAHIVSKQDIENNTAGQFETGVFLTPTLTTENTQFATGKFPKADGKYKEGFGVNAKKVAGDPNRKAVVEDFFQYMTSNTAQDKYVVTANSFSPTVGVQNPEELMEWVFPMDAEKTTNEIYGQCIIEWAAGNWPNYLQEFIQGKKTAQQLIDAVSKESKKNVVDWYSAEPDAIKAQIDEKQAMLDSATDDQIKKALTEQIQTLKIARVLYAQAVEEGKNQ